MRKNSKKTRRGQLNCLLPIVVDSKTVFSGLWPQVTCEWPRRQQRLTWNKLQRCSLFSWGVLPRCWLTVSIWVLVPVCRQIGLGCVFRLFSSFSVYINWKHLSCSLRPLGSGEMSLGEVSSSRFSTQTQTHMISIRYFSRQVSPIEKTTEEKSRKRIKRHSFGHTCFQQLAAIRSRG